MATLKFKKLPAKTGHFLLPFFISILMSGLVSAIATVHNSGVKDGFPDLWLSSWAISWIIAFPCLLLVLPMAKKMVSFIVETA